MIATKEEALEARAYAKRFCTNYPGQGSNFVVIYEAFLAGIQHQKSAIQKCRHPRRKYRWGHYDVLRNLEVGTEMIVGRGDKRECSGFRIAASKLGNLYGVTISIRHTNGAIYARRIK